MEMVAGQVETVAKQVELVAGNRAVPEAPSRSAGRGLEKSLSMLARPSGRGPTSPNSILPTTRPRIGCRKERIGADSVFEACWKPAQAVVVRPAQRQRARRRSLHLRGHWSRSPTWPAALWLPACLEVPERPRHEHSLRVAMRFGFASGRVTPVARSVSIEQTSEGPPDRERAPAALDAEILEAASEVDRTLIQLALRRTLRERLRAGASLARLAARFRAAPRGR